MDIKGATITIYEAAALLGINRNSAYNAAKRGEIPTVRIGKRLLVVKHRLNELLGHSTNEGQDVVAAPVVQDLPEGQDGELDAIAACVEVLNKRTGAQRQRVIHYLADRYGVAFV